MYAKELRQLDHSFLSEIRNITKSDTVEVIVVDSEIRIKPYCSKKMKPLEVIKKYDGVVKTTDKVYSELLKYRDERNHEDREVPDIVTHDSDYFLKMKNAYDSLEIEDPIESIT